MHQRSQTARAVVVNPKSTTIVSKQKSNIDIALSVEHGVPVVATVQGAESSARSSVEQLVL